MIVRLILLMLIPVVPLASLVAQERTPDPIMVPMEFCQNFEEGHLSGWESYPPFQDSAFDPDFKCTREDCIPGSKFALMRKVQVGFRSPYEIGFIRKIRLRLTRSSRLSFGYLLRMYGDATKLEAVLCGTDGKKYAYTMPPPSNDQWHTAVISLPSFRHGKEPFPAGGEIQALYLVAVIGKTNPDIAYRFFLDNVALTGLRPAQFRIQTPGSSLLEHWGKTVLHHHYAAEETLALAASLPSGITLSTVRFSLTNPHGKTVVPDLPLGLRKETGCWEHPRLYTFSARDVNGRWQGRLWGEDAEGRQVETLFDVWVTDKGQPHPRLYFGQDSLAWFADRARTPKWKPWFDSLAARASRLRTTSNLGSIVLGPETSSLTSLQDVDLNVYDTTNLLPTLSHYYGVMYPAMEMLYNHAFLFAFNRDSAAGEWARNALVAIAGWKSWTHPWFRARHQESYYPVGELGVRAAFCYDVIAPLLNEKERGAVQEGLLRNCIIPVYNEYVVEDRIPSSTSNWIANSISGALSCIAAIYGDNPARSECEPYFTGLRTKLEEHIRSTLDTSGAWGEGIGYQSFAYTNMLPTLTALARVFHQDMASAALTRSYLYFLYNASPPEVIDVGDSHVGLGAASSFAWLLSRTDDPLFRWLYQQGPREHALDFLFGGQDGPVSRPDSLPKAKLFADIGSVVFRSGWKQDDIVLSFRCGPFFNHQHFDQGSFQLRAFGETLVPEAGVVHYYNDPWYQSYYIQAVGHNTVLVDDNPGSQRSGDYLHFVGAANTGARMWQFIGTEFYSAATGEVQAVYRDSLALFERNIVFMQPDYFVLCDRLRSTGKNHKFSWLLHFDERRDVAISGHDITITRGHASLQAKVLSPTNAAIKVQGAPSRLGVPLSYPGYIAVSNMHASCEENFLVVLYPTRMTPSIAGTNQFAAGNLTDRIAYVRAENATGARITRGEEEDLILFRTADDHRAIMDGSVKTDGRLVAHTTSGKVVRRLAVHDGTYLVCTDPGWRTSFDTLRASVKITAAVSLRDEVAQWEIQSSEAGLIFLHSLQEPREVKQDGQRVPEDTWDDERRLLTLVVPKGSSRFTIRYQPGPETGRKD
jgi:hypothetical protein